MGRYGFFLKKKKIIAMFQATMFSKVVVLCKDWGVPSPNMPARVGRVEQILLSLQRKRWAVETNYKTKSQIEISCKSRRNAVTCSRGVTQQVGFVLNKQSPSSIFQRRRSECVRVLSKNRTLGICTKGCVSG